MAAAGRRAAALAVTGRATPSDPRVAFPAEVALGIPPRDTPTEECHAAEVALAAVAGRCSTGTEAEGRSTASGVAAALEDEEGRAARQEGLEVAGRRRVFPEEAGRRGLDPAEVAGRRGLHPEERQGEAAIETTGSAPGKVTIVTAGS